MDFGTKANQRGYTVKAFTLIELLVVIAVIALLAAILFPVMGGVREKARQTTCSSNLKQIGTALLLYTDDWDGFCPGHGEGGPYVSDNELISRYLSSSNPGVWLCPSDPNLEEKAQLLAQGNTGGGQADSYNLSWFVVGGSRCADVIGTYPRLLASVKKPSSFVLYLEGTVGEPFPAYSPNWAHQLDPDWLKVAWDRAAYTGRWHRGRGNYLFVDGHVRLLSVRQTLVPEVMWDNIRDWCPGCDCGGWNQQDIKQDLAALDKLHLP